MALYSRFYAFGGPTPFLFDHDDVAVRHRLSHLNASYEQYINHHLIYASLSCPPWLFSLFFISLQKQQKREKVSFTRYTVLACEIPNFGLRVSKIFSCTRTFFRCLFGATPNLLTNQGKIVCFVCQ